MAFAWIFPAFVLGIIPTIQGINESASVTSYKPITTEPSLQTSIKPHISVISTIKTGSHTHQVEDNATNTISNISVVHTVQASYSSNEGSHWVTMPTPLRLGMTTTFIGSSVTGNLQSASIDFKDTTNMNQKTEIRSWSLTSYPSLNTNLNTFKSIGTSDNSIAHVTHTTFSSKKESSVKQLSLLPFSTQSYGPNLPSSVSFSSASPESSKNKTIESVSEHQLVSTVPISRATSEHSREVWTSKIGSSSVLRLTEASGYSMAVLFSTHVAVTTSMAHQNSLKVDNGSKLVSQREDNATTAVNCTAMTFITRTKTTTTTTTTTIATVESSLLSSPAVVMDTSLLHSITKGSASGYQERQTGNISRQATPTIILDGTVVSLKLASLTSMKSPSTRPVTRQSTCRGVITSVSRQEEPVSSGSHFATTTMAETTATPGGLSKTQTARNSFSSIISLQRTVARVSPTETILPSFQTKGSKGSLFVTPVAGHTSTMKLSVQENGSFSGTSTTKTSSIFKGLSSVSSFQGESLPTSTETVVFPMKPTTTPIGEPNTSYNIPDLSKTIDLPQTLKLSNIFTRIRSVSASLDSTFFPIVQNKTTSIPMIDSTRTRVNSVSRDSSTMGSSLPPASLKNTIVSSGTKTSLLSMIYKTTDVFSDVSDTGSPFITMMSSLSIAQKKTSLKQITASSKTTDVSSEVHAAETSVSVYPNSTIGSTLSMVQNKASSIQMTTSFLSISSDVKDSRKPLSSYNASGNIVTSIHQTDKKVASFSATHSKKFTIKESRSNWVTDTVGKSSIEHTSTKLTRSQYMTPTRDSATFSSSVEAVRERINTSNIRSFGSSLETRPAVDVGTSRHTSNIKSIMSQSTSSVKSVSDIPYPSTTSLTDKSTLSANGLITTTPLTRSTIGRGSRLRSQAVTPLSSSLPLVVISGDRETFVLTTQNPSQVVSVSMKDKTSTHDDVITVHSTSTESNLSSVSGLPSTNNTKQEQTSNVLSSKLTSLGDTSAWETSTVQHSYNDPHASSNEKLSRTSVSSTRHSSQDISTSVSKGIMLSNTSHADYPNSLLSTTTLLQSSRKLASRYIHSTQGLTSQPSSTQSQPFESSQGTSHTLATRKRYSSKQSSQTMSSDLQKMASTVQRLSATTLRLSSAFMKRSKSTKSDMSTFTTYQTMKSLFLSQNTAASQMSVSGEIASTDFIVGLSSINTPGRQSRLVSSTDISKHRGSASSPLASLKLSTDPVLMSTSSWIDEITEVTTVASRSIFVTTSHLIKSTIQPYGSVSTNVLPGYSSWSLPSKTKGTLDNIQTQASITSHVVLPSASRTSSIALATTKTFRNATPAPVTSFSVSTQTALLPESPKQFDGRMILQMPWQPEYQYSYTPEYQALASTITRQLTKVLQTLEGFLSVQVIRLWKSSVGVDFIVLVRKSAQVSEKSVERTIIEANNTGVLDLPLTSLQVQEKESLPTYHPTHEDKSIETWKIIIIVAGILVFLMLLIICILVVKLTKQSGGLRRSRKYELSSVNNYLYTDYADSGSKPVILRMEERRQDDRIDPVAVSAYGVYGAYGMVNSNSDESLSFNDDRIPAKEYSNHNNRNSSKGFTTSDPVVSRMDPVAVNTHTTMNSNSEECPSHNEGRMPPKTCTNNSNSEFSNSSKDSIASNVPVTSQLNEPNHNCGEDPVTAVTPCTINGSNGSNEATTSTRSEHVISVICITSHSTTSSSSTSQTKENQQESISTDENGSHQNQGYN